MSDLTYKFASYGIIPTQDFSNQECIRWAIELIEDGFESEHLYILAGLSENISYFEIIAYVKEVLKDINIDEKTGEDAILSYSYYYVSRISRGENVRKNVSIIASICIDNNHASTLMDFYLLYSARNDLDSQDVNFYREGATKDTIESIVIERAKIRINKHITHL